jgi:hypothetical protein
MRTRMVLSTTFSWIDYVAAGSGGVSSRMLGGSAMPTALEDAADVTSDWRAQQESLAILLGLDLLQAIELANERAPFRLQARGGKMVVQGLAQHEGEE